MSVHGSAARAWVLAVGLVLVAAGGWLAVRGSEVAAMVHLAAGTGLVLVALRAASDRGLAGLAGALALAFAVTGLLGLAVDDAGALGTLTARDDLWHMGAALSGAAASLATRMAGPRHRGPALPLRERS